MFLQLSSHVCRKCSVSWGLTDLQNIKLIKTFFSLPFNFQWVLWWKHKLVRSWNKFQLLAAEGLTKWNTGYTLSVFSSFLSPQTSSTEPGGSSLSPDDKNIDPSTTKNNQTSSNDMENSQVRMQASRCQAVMELYGFKNHNIELGGAIELYNL